MRACKVQLHIYYFFTKIVKKIFNYVYYKYRYGVACLRGIASFPKNMLSTQKRNDNTKK